MPSDWMSSRQVSEESGRHQESVLLALHRGLLKGSQARAGCSWRVKRSDFDAWMAAGCPLDRPQVARLRRSA
jgi:hypothetical protein